MQKISAIKIPTRARQVQAVTEIYPTLSVKDFGAVGDYDDETRTGTDDTAAFNLAFAAIKAHVYDYRVGASLMIPPGRYRIDGCIDATLFNAHGFSIQAEGAILFSRNAGGVCLDLTGSRWLQLQGLEIVGDSTDVPACGLRFGRTGIASTTGEATRLNTYSAGPNHFSDVTITGHFTQCGMYNHASEVLHADKLTIYNNYNNSSAHCLIQDGKFTNGKVVFSPNIGPANDGEVGTTVGGDTYISYDTASSFNENLFTQLDLRKINTGSPLWMTRTTAHQYINSYCVSYDGAGVIVHSDSFGHLGLHLDIHTETTGLQFCVQFDGDAFQTIRQFYFRDHNTYAADSVFKSGTGVTTVVLLDADINITNYAVVPTNKTFSTASVFKVSGKIHVNNGTYYNAPGVMNGTVSMVNRALAEFGAGTQTIRDYVNNDSVVKGTMVFSDGDATTGAAGALGNAGEVTVELGTVLCDEGTYWGKYRESQLISTKQSSSRWNRCILSNTSTLRIGDSANTESVLWGSNNNGATTNYMKMGMAENGASVVTFLQALPTQADAANLPTGTLYQDTSAGNVVKVK